MFTLHIRGPASFRHPPRTGNRERQEKRKKKKRKGKERLGNRERQKTRKVQKKKKKKNTKLIKYITPQNKKL